MIMSVSMSMSMIEIDEEKDERGVDEVAVAVRVELYIITLCFSREAAKTCRVTALLANHE